MAHALEAHTVVAIDADMTGSPPLPNCSAASFTTAAYCTVPENTVMSNSSRPSPSGEKLSDRGLAMALAPATHRL